MKPKQKRPLKQTILIEGVKLFFLWAFLSPFVFQMFYDKLLFMPSKENYDQAVASPLKQIENQLGVKKEDVWFAGADGKRMHGWLLRSPGAHRTILITHGNAGNLAHRLILATALLACKNSVFLYDYEGYGKSEGEPTRSNVIESGPLAYDYLVNTANINPKEIIVYGESIGTAVACQLSKHRKVSGIILQSGFPSLLEAAHDRLWFSWFYPNSWYSMLEPFDNLAVVRAQHAPLLVIHGKDDSILPWRYSQEIYDVASSPKTLALIDSLPHILERIDDMPYLKAINEFVASLDSNQKH